MGDVPRRRQIDDAVSEMWRRQRYASALIADGEATGGGGIDFLARVWTRNFYDDLGFPLGPFAAEDSELSVWHWPWMDGEGDEILNEDDVIVIPESGWYLFVGTVLAGQARLGGDQESIDVGLYAEDYDWPGVAPRATVPVPEGEYAQLPLAGASLLEAGQKVLLLGNEGPGDFYHPSTADPLGGNGESGPGVVVGLATLAIARLSTGTSGEGGGSGGGSILITDGTATVDPLSALTVAGSGGIGVELVDDGEGAGTLTIDGSEVAGDGGIPASVLEETGDLIYASAASTAGRLAIGDDGDVLVAFEGAPIWVPMPSFIPQTLISAAGDLIVGTADDTAGILSPGADGEVLTIVSGVPAWDEAPSGGGSGIPETLIDAEGDLIYGSADDTAARLPIGSNGEVLSVSGGAPSWEALPEIPDALVVDDGSTEVDPVSRLNVSGAGGVEVDLTDDGSGEASLEVDGSALALPPGIIQPYGGSSAPTGYLLCDGSAVSRTTYADLFAAIGTAYGAGNGTTTFNLPNMKGRVPVGRDAAQSEFDTLGETGGAKTHTLTEAEMPEHNHTFQLPRTHDSGASGLNTVMLRSVIDSNSGNFTVSDAGSDDPHNNLQPYQVVNYLIKT